MEDEEQEDQNDLVEELTPTLHQESACDFSTSVETIFLGRDFAGTDGVLHTRCSSHRVLTTNTDPVEEERPDVADHPSILSDTPCRGQHDKPDKHDCGILN